MPRHSFIHPFNKYLISTYWVQSAVLGIGDKVVNDSGLDAQAGEDEINVPRLVVPAQLPQVGRRLGSGIGVHLTGESLKTLRLVVRHPFHGPIQK